MFIQKKQILIRCNKEQMMMKAKNNNKINKNFK